MKRGMNHPWKRGAGAAGLLALILGTSGCYRTPVYVNGSPTGPQSYVTLSHPNLYKAIVVTETRMSDLNGLLNAGVMLKSQSRKTQEFEYRFQWYDGAGIEVSDNKTHWRLDRLYAGEEKLISSVAPNERVVSFKTIIRRPEPVTR